MPDHSRLCIALIDLDGLAEINQQFGYRTGSQILKAAATLLEDLHTENVRVARFSGQRFLLMFSDVDSSAATEMVERFRQTVDKAHFEHEDFDIRVTVSCAVTRAREEDSPSSVLLRAESVLGEAKAYGRNRTFRHDGKFPGPVVAGILADRLQMELTLEGLEDYLELEAGHELRPTTAIVIDRDQVLSPPDPSPSPGSGPPVGVE